MLKEHKVIDLDADEVFRNSEEYDDNKEYATSHNIIQKAATVQDIIFDLLIEEKLDKTDLKIIRARDCTPMPTMRDLAARFNVSHTAIEKRVAKINRLITALMPQNPCL